MIEKKLVKNILSTKTVTILFSMLIIFGFLITEVKPVMLMNEIVKLFLKNSFLVLALLIPIRAGMGFNFSIVIGAMAGQLGVIATINKGFVGFQSFLIAVIFATPLALFLGFIAGKLLNKARGHEMIASLFLAYFTNGIYQIICLFFMGDVIPVKSKELILPSGVGLRNTYNLSGTLKGSVDAIFGGILQVPIFNVLLILGVIATLIFFYLFSRSSTSINKSTLIKLIVVTVLSTLFSFIVMYTDLLPSKFKLIKNVKLPLATLALLLLFIAFNQLFIKRDIDYQVERNRVLSITLSIVLAAWGQIIYLQSNGILITYGAHAGVGILSVVALLIGGASIKKATVGQALLGTLLFQCFFVLSPSLSSYFFPEKNLSEIFRLLILNGVIFYAFIQSRSGLGTVPLRVKEINK